MRRSCAAGRWALAWKLLAPATLCPLPVGTRHMNLKFLETFVWVARLKSFRLTAEKLFSTQASISSRIAVLEDELGVKLFVRDSRGVTLTPEGDKVLAYAERMMDTMHALKQSLDTGASTQGRIRIGAMDTVIHTWLSPLVARVTETFPAVEIELMADTARNLSEQLQKGYLDLIFQTDSLRHESVLNLELGSYPLRWIVSTGSIYHRDYASLADLARERVVTFSKHSRPHQDVLGLLHANGVAAPRLNCVNSVAAMTRLLRDGFGVGALPPALVSQELERGELTLLRLGPPPPNLPVVVSWRGGTGLELVDEVVEPEQGGAGRLRGQRRPGVHAPGAAEERSGAAAFALIRIFRSPPAEKSRWTLTAVRFYKPANNDVRQRTEPPCPNRPSTNSRNCRRRSCAN